MQLQGSSTTSRHYRSFRRSETSKANQMPSTTRSPPASSFSCVPWQAHTGLSSPQACRLSRLGRHGPHTCRSSKQLLRDDKFNLAMNGARPSSTYRRGTNEHLPSGSPQSTIRAEMPDLLHCFLLRFAWDSDRHATSLRTGSFVILELHRFFSCSTALQHSEANASLNTPQKQSCSVYSGQSTNNGCISSTHLGRRLGLAWLGFREVTGMAGTNACAYDTKAFAKPKPKDYWRGVEMRCNHAFGIRKTTNSTVLQLFCTG